MYGSGLLLGRARFSLYGEFIIVYKFVLYGRQALAGERKKEERICPGWKYMYLLTGPGTGYVK